MIDGPRVPPRAGRAEALVVFCHGYGADGHDLIGLAGEWQALLPRAAFAAPHAPEPCDMGMGRQWFAIDRSDPGRMGGGVERAGPALEAFLAAECTRWQVPPERLALVGFSQGTMVALHVGLARRPAPAAILGYSGALAAPPEAGRGAAPAPEILLIHGAADEVIPADALFMTAGALGAAGLRVSWHLSPGLGHGIDPEGMARGAAFVAAALTAGPRGGQ